MSKHEIKLNKNELQQVTGGFENLKHLYAKINHNKKKNHLEVSKKTSFSENDTVYSKNTQKNY